MVVVLVQAATMKQTRQRRSLQRDQNTPPPPHTHTHPSQKILEERGLGRVCFMPLNRLRVKPVAYPDSADVVPLLAAALEYPREVGN